MKIEYEKRMMNYNIQNHSWTEIENTMIVKLLEQLKNDLYSSYQGVKFHFKVKPSNYSRYGIIKIKTNLDKLTLIIKVGEILADSLELRW